MTLYIQRPKQDRQRLLSPPTERTSYFSWPVPSLGMIGYCSAKNCSSAMEMPSGKPEKVFKNNENKKKKKK
jgi:hypothetical protein